jgi:hypothetical protein
MHALGPKSLLLSDVEDAELARRIVARDEAAFELLMRRNNGRLFRAARSIVADDAEAEDVVQQTYLTAYATMARYRGDARLSTWLTRIALNEALARVRRHMSQHKLTDIDNVIDLEARLAAAVAMRTARRRSTQRFGRRPGVCSSRRLTRCLPPTEPCSCCTRSRNCPSTRLRRCSAARKPPCARASFAPGAC